MEVGHLAPSIPSRPVYSTLQIHQGRHHLMIADAEGAEAIIGLDSNAPAGFWDKVHIIYIPKKTGDTYLPSLEALNAACFYCGPSYEAARQRIEDTLAKARMGLWLYLAGTEGLIGQAMAAAIVAGIPHTAIQTEHRGSTARRMQCVHCKGITEDVTTDPFVCSHCGLNLFVRDHYSRRLAAFQGVCVDAEDPGQVPEQVELFT